MKARQLIDRAKQQLTDATVQRDFINLIETIIVYKRALKLKLRES